MAVPTSTHNRNGISAIFSIFKCCSKSNIARSQRFHAHEDSVHVMMKHDIDIDAAQKRAYVPRARFPDSLAAGRKTASPAIQATDATGESNADK
eukprot:scaffold8982_cov96-Skeletonema_dohrnii-CCMP3373.AAC.5